jgi:hypothetical protein
MLGDVAAVGPTVEAVGDSVPSCPFSGSGAGDGGSVLLPLLLLLLLPESEPSGVGAAEGVADAAAGVAEVGELVGEAMMLPWSEGPCACGCGRDVCQQNGLLARNMQEDGVHKSIYLSSRRGRRARTMAASSAAATIALALALVAITIPSRSRRRRLGGHNSPAYRLGRRWDGHRLAHHRRGWSRGRTAGTAAIAPILLIAAGGRRRRRALALAAITTTSATARSLH